MLRVRGKVVGVTLALGLLGCESQDSAPFANLRIELPRATHGTPFDGRDCVTIAIAPSAPEANPLAEATVLVGTGKYDLAQYVKARGSEQGREDLVKALVAVIEEHAAMREKVPRAAGTASEVPVLVCADRRVGAEYFMVVLIACARAKLYKIHVRVTDRDVAPTRIELSGPVLRCWLPVDRGLSSLPDAASLRELCIALTRNAGVTEGVIMETALRTGVPAYDPLRKKRAASGETKAREAEPAPKRVAVPDGVPALNEEILRAKRAFDETLRSLADAGMDIASKVRRQDIPVTLDPAPDVPFQDLVTVLDACIGCGIKMIEFKAPKGR